MSIVAWGLQPKSQFDNETIEEAIARLIAVHEADEASHLGVGESLQSHKASSIIDHLAASIVSDKIASHQVTVDKTIDDKQVLKLSLESLDGWQITKVGAQSSIAIFAGSIHLIGGWNLNDYASCYIYSAMFPLMCLLNPVFQVMANFYNNNHANDIVLMIGGNDPWTLYDCWGFKWDSATSKLYCFYAYGSSVTQFEIVGFDHSLTHTFRAEYSYSAQTLTFYVDFVAVKVFSSVVLSFVSTAYFYFGAKAKASPTGASLYIASPLFYQDFLY